jgi:dihydropyrimidinase
MYDIVIQDGTLVTSTGLIKADLGIRDGKIAEIAPQLSGVENISASGLLVLPGGVDPHVHIEMPTPLTTTSDTWETGSRAAAFGGTTTVVDFVEPSYPGQSLLDAFNFRLNQAQGKSAIDYSFHMTLCSADEATLRQIPAVVAAGMSSFKLYTTYVGFKLDDEDLLAAFQAIARANGLAIVHAESDAIIQNATRILQAANRLSVSDFPASRPAFAEKEAVERVLNLAAYAGAPVYIVHVSTQAAAEAIAHARRTGQPVWGETCPQYLLLDDGCLKTGGFSGAKFVCCPPLRTPQDKQALWNALQQGELQTVGTDHCAFNFAGQKDLGNGSFLEIPSGLPGIELRLSLVFTYGVKTGRLTLSQWVDRCCTTPARLFRMYPRKGDLITGADADIVIFDPEAVSTIARPLLHEQVDYTPYEGMQLVGKVRATLLRGQVLVRNGEWVGEAHDGEYLEC